MDNLSRQFTGLVYRSLSMLETQWAFRHFFPFRHQNLFLYLQCKDYSCRMHFTKRRVGFDSVAHLYPICNIFGPMCYAALSTTIMKMLFHTPADFQRLGESIPEVSQHLSKKLYVGSYFNLSLTCIIYFVLFCFFLFVFFASVSGTVSVFLIIFVTCTWTHGVSAGFLSN